MRVALLLSLTASLVAVASDVEPMAVRKKGILASGWDLLHVTTDDVHRNREKFAATGVDGVLLPLTGKRQDGTAVNGLWPMNGKDWTDAAFAETRRQLAEITQQPGLGESFALVLWTPAKRLAWTDDSAWKSFGENLAILARTARAGGLKGFVIDHEDYSKTRQFLWMDGDPDQDELIKVVRRRGREVFGRLYAEFPEAAVMAYYLFSEPRNAMTSAYPAAANLAKGDLWTMFLNGLLDVAPRGAHILDGCEHYCYGANAAKDEFRQRAETVRLGHAQFVLPSNRAKYAETLSIAFGQYLDNYVNNAKRRPWFMPLDGSLVRRFAVNFAGAMKVSDEYVWVYGEKGTWIDWDDKKGDPVLKAATWESQMPGLAEMFRAAKGELVSVRLCDTGLVNVFKNADCDPVPGQKLPLSAWSEKKDGPSQFAYEPDFGASKPGCLKLTGYGLYAFDVGGLKTGEKVVLKVKACGRSAALCVIWSIKGERQWGVPMVDVGPTSKMREDEWVELETVLTVPDGKDLFVGEIDGINVQLIGTYASPEHPVYYDDIRVLRRASEIDR